MANWLTRIFAGKSNKVTTSEELLRVLRNYGIESYSGEIITPESAMALPPLQAAVTLISESVAQLPIHIYRRLPSGDKEPVDNSLRRLLRVKPNSFMNAFEFKEYLTVSMLLTGNGYAFINRLNNGAVGELIPINPYNVRPEMDENYRITYDVLMANGTYKQFTADKIFHIKDRTTDGVKGVSRISQSRDAIGLAKIAEKWGALLFKNGARPQGVLSTERVMNDEQIKRIAESWNRSQGGDNALGTAILDGGFEFKTIGMNNTDAQFIELRKFQISEISRIFRVPPHMIGDLEKATFSNIEHQSLEFVKYTLMSWLKRWEYAIDTQLLNTRTDLFAEYVVEDFLRGDIQSRYGAYSTALLNGFMSVNEVRRRENMNPIGEEGDKYNLAENLYGDQNADTTATV